MFSLKTAIMAQNCKLLKYVKIYFGVKSWKLFSTTNICKEEMSYKLVIAGGGSGGATMAARLVSKMGKNNVLVIEPSDVHYYQPYFTLVGAGMVDLEQCRFPMSMVLPKDVKWLRDKVVSFNPSQNIVETEKGSKIKYDILIVALGLRLGFEKIAGLPEALNTPGVCSNYSPNTVRNTAADLRNFSKGNAIFTQPVSPIKCAGAPQKIAYLADEILRKSGKRKDANILFYTAMKSIFSVPRYSASLTKVAANKGITVHYEHNLVEVKPDTKEAVFEKIGIPGNPKVNVKYEMLHLVPPMFPQVALEKSPLADSTGYLDVDKFTLQHKKYQNVFGIGDSLNVPTSKTAAAVAGQCGILTDNIISFMEGKRLSSAYNGYTSCPLVTGYSKCIMAEFGYDLDILETLPIDQSKERYICFIIKKHVLPFLYWNSMLKGHWKGPSAVRKILHLGMSA